MTKLIATVSMDKIDSNPVVRFKKGDAFVHYTIKFSEVL